MHLRTVEKEEERTAVATGCKIHQFPKKHLFCYCIFAMLNHHE